LSGTKEDQVIYYVEKAGEMINDAKLLADNAAWTSCMNRLYYACYYAVTALLLKYGIPVKTHSGIKTQFNLHFVKAGIVSKEQGKLYAELMNWREKSDYSAFFNANAQSVGPLIQPAVELVKVIVVLIESKQ